MTDRTKAMDDLIAQDADLIDQQNAEIFTRPENVQTKPEKLGMGDDALVLELTNEIMGRTATVAARAILPIIKADREAVRAEQAAELAKFKALAETLAGALEKIEKAPAWGYPDKWETTPAEVRWIAREALRKYKEARDA